MNPPLIVDLDGTLLRSDLLIESFFALASHHPLKALGAVAALTKGRAAFKHRLAAKMNIDPATLPYSDAVLAEIASAREAGQQIWLVSASDESLVRKIAAHLGGFDGVIGSDGVTNLRGETKARVLVAKFGERGFDYLGNDQTDIAVWNHARRVLMAHPAAKFQRQITARYPGSRAVGSPARPTDRLNALRPHQWLKNLLVFVPVLAAHHFGTAPLFAAIMTFVAISLTASALYLINDLIDLARDRAHPTKRHRPLAAGKIPLQEALMMVPMLLVAAILVCSVLPRIELAVLAGYAVTSLAYTLILKRLMMIDVVTLACLYGVRLVLGAVGADVKLTAWLAAFSLFLFFSLALVKRTAELAHRKTPGPIAGRSYMAGDEPLLAALASASGMVSVLVFALYVNSPEVRVLYHAPNHLWFICVVLLYWIGRVLMLSHRGEMHADPVVFAVTDKISLISILVAGAILVSAL